MSPRLIPGLEALWYADQALTTVGPDAPAGISDPVCFVPDASGNGRHLEQTTMVMQPTLQYLNGLNAANGYAMKGDGANTRISSAAFSLPTTRTVMMVVNSPPGSPASALLHVGDSWSSNGGGGCWGATSDCLFVSWGGGINTKNSLDGPIADSRGFSVLFYQVSKVGDDARIWRGTDEVPLSGTWSSTNGSFTLPVHLFSRPATPIYSSGYIGMVAIWNRFLTASERVNLNNFAKRKYQLP